MLGDWKDFLKICKITNDIHTLLTTFFSFLKLFLQALLELTFAWSRIKRFVNSLYCIHWAFSSLLLLSRADGTYVRGRLIWFRTFIIKNAPLITLWNYVCHFFVNLFTFWCNSLFLFVKSEFLCVNHFHVFKEKSYGICLPGLSTGVSKGFTSKNKRKFCEEYKPDIFWMSSSF